MFRFSNLSTDVRIPTNGMFNQNLKANNFGIVNMSPDYVLANGTAKSLLIKKIASLLWRSEHGPRFAFLQGFSEVENEFGDDVEAEALFARAVVRSLVGQLGPLLITEKRDEINPLNVEMKLVEYSIEGYGTNKSYAPPYEGMISRDSFYSTKAPHFDAAEPIASNIYGYFENIAGGFPIACDVAAFCDDHELYLPNILKRLDGYPVGIEERYQRKLLSDYTLCFDVNFADQLGCLITMNDVSIGGIAHGATEPKKADNSITAKRPLFHVGYDYADLNDVERWYCSIGF